MHRALECAAGDRMKPMVQSTPSPWLSVLVPVYGVERWIRQCMESVLSQADDGVEILVLDDASPDGSMAIVHELQQRHPGRIRVLEHPRNRGLSAARNSLMDAATGRYFWFLDSDDVLLPGAIERLRGVVAREAPDLVLCDFRVLREDSGLLHRLRGEMHRRSFAGWTRAGSGRDALLAGLLEARQFHAWSKIATAGIWRAARFPEGRYFEDIAVIAPLCAPVRNWRHVPEPWVGYRQRDGSILSDMTPAKTRDLLASLRDLHRGVTAMQGLSARTRHALEYACLRAFAALARKMPGDESLERECLAVMAEVFPQGIPRVLADCRRRGWWLRAWRAGHSLARRGWGHHAGDQERKRPAMLSRRYSPRAR